MPSPPQVNCRVLLLKEMAENEHDNGKEHRSYSGSAACRKMSSIGVGSRLPGFVCKSTSPRL